MYGGCKAAGHTLLCLFVLFCVRTDSDELQSVTVWFWLVFFVFFMLLKNQLALPRTNPVEVEFTWVCRRVLAASCPK